MRKYEITLAAFLALLFIMTSQTVAQGPKLPDGTYPTVSRWPEQSLIKPTMFEEWKANSSVRGRFEAESLFLKDGVSGDKSPGYICIVINRQLYYQTSHAMSRFIDDLTIDGYTVELILSQGGEARDLRQLLADRYTSGMIGAILIGDLPMAWYEISCFWGEVYSTYEEWPCDLYYMDVNGEWEDRDSDGILDNHIGDIFPEIWIGRLTPSPLTLGTGTEATLLENYLHKNHQYRQGGMPLANKALFYTDDDWAPSNYLNNIIGTVYENRTHVWDQYETNADNYRETITEHFEFIHVNAHSDPHSHYFSVPGGDTRTVSYSDIVTIDPPAAFYNLYACSNIRYSDNNYMGGWYIFKSQFGLAAVGSSKTGGMLYDEDFYSHLAADSSFGEAFREWFRSTLGSGWVESEIICWFYGMTLCGDPTLHLKQSSYISILGANFSDVAGGDGDFKYEEGETVLCEFALKNTGSRTARDVTLTLSCNDNQLPFSTYTSSVGDIDTGQTVMTPADISFSIPADYNPRVDSFCLEISFNEGGALDTVWYEFTIGTPRVLLVDDDGSDDIEEYYKTYFDNMCIPYDIVETIPVPTGAQLIAYDIVIWFTGDYRLYPISSNDIISLTEYLDSGGNLVLSGQAIAAQLQNDDIGFLNDYLKAEYTGTSYIPLLLCQPEGLVLGDLGDTVSIQGNLGAHNQTAPDHITPYGGGVSELLYFSTADYGAVSYAGDYKLVFCSFGLEALSTFDTRWLIRDTVLAHIFDFFEFAYPSEAAQVNSVSISPGDPGLMFDHHPTFSWTYSDPAGLPQSLYQVRVSGTGYQSSTVMYDTGPLSGTAATLAYPLDNLIDGETYEVAVRVASGSVWSDWAIASMHFNSIPCPLQLQPSGGISIDDLSPPLCYDNALDKEGHDVIYSSELYADPQLTILLESQYDIDPGSDTLCQWNIGTVLEEDEWYYWRVRGTDTYETGQWGEPAVFRIGAEYICGDANGDEAINVGDPVFIISFIFKGGPAPDPEIAGDANCDTALNIGDAVYLINHVFKGGAAPCAGCP